MTHRVQRLTGVFLAFLLVQRAWERLLYADFWAEDGKVLFGQALTDGFPTVGGLTWIPDDGDDITDPLFVDRRRLGGIAREQIPSPEYRAIGGDTGVEIASIREPKADKTRLQARNVHVPIVTNPLAGFYLTGTEAP